MNENLERKLSQFGQSLKSLEKSKADSMYIPNEFSSFNAARVVSFSASNMFPELKGQLELEFNNPEFHDIEKEKTDEKKNNNNIDQKEISQSQHQKKPANSCKCLIC